MKFISTKRPYLLLLLFILISVGIIFSLRAKSSAHHTVQIAMAKNHQLTYEPRATETQDLPLPLPVTHFEPLLLFVLGTLLLSIVTGINLIRSRKSGLRLHTGTSASLESRRKFATRHHRVKKNSAA
ncbi:MAG: hypothetical protein HY231_13545 [Acidobacteria bacterium]|nr:hypothetical protein [Acidobacteriota bacterium]